MATMKMARVHGPRDVRLDDVPVPIAGSKDVIVRVKACGICGSDLGYIERGGMAGPSDEPLPIGHEFSGEVVAVGADVKNVAIGLRVAVNPDDSMIGSGGPDAAMAPFVRVAAAKVGDNLLPIPDHISDVEAALAEPLSVALHAINITHTALSDKVAILGAGPIGLCALAALRQRGHSNVAIFDREEARLERALALGAAEAVKVERDGDMTAALARAHGESVRFGVPCVGTDVFIDAAGAPSALSEVISIAKFRSRIAIVALYKKPCPIDLFKLMANEILMTGSIGHDRKEEFASAVEMVCSGTMDFRPIISHQFDMARFHEALATAADPAISAKVMLTFEGVAA